MGEKTEPDKLCFILGCGRSGTSWCASVLAKTATLIRYCHEFLSYVRPRRFFSMEHDYTAIPYKSMLDCRSPLVVQYDYSTLEGLDRDRFMPQRYEKQIRRDDEDYHYVLHKEVHSLLATEGLVRYYSRNRFILLTRNPIYNVDSLFNYLPHSSGIWRNESRYIQDEEFRARFLPGKGEKVLQTLADHRDDGENRTNCMIAKTITVAAMNQMLKKVAQDNTNGLLLTYEQLCT